MSEDVVPVRRIREESILTGEAVELEVRPASPVLRMAAALVDMAITVLVVIDVVLVQARVVGLPQTSSLMRVWVIGILVLAWIVTPVTVETLTRGRSLGKWALGLQVVRDDGGVITLRHALVRALTGTIEIWATLGSIALVCAVVTPRSKRLGDLAAGTLVVRIPEPVRHLPLLLPPDLREWAARAQILDPGQMLQSDCLAYLRTTGSLNPALRPALAGDLARRLSAHVAPLPPQGTNPERFIAAVLVVLRDREYHRLVARQELARARREAVGAPPFAL